MQLFIRYNAQEGKQTKKALDKFYGYLISGPHVEYYIGAFSALIAETKRPFVIDPSLYCLDLDRKSHTKYWNKLGIDSEFPFGEKRRENIGKILNHQLNRVNEELAQDALEEISGDFKPEFLIAPAGITSDSDSINLNIEAISISKDLMPENMVYAVIVISKETLLIKNLVNEIVAGFGKSKADGFCISIEEFKGEVESTELLSAYRDFVKGLGHFGKPVVSLYGGFFDLLLAQHGMSVIVHGVDSGEKFVNSKGKKSGGRKINLYYAYKLKMKLPPNSVDFVKSKAKEILECDCPFCGGDSPERNDYLQHFLYCRQKEVEEVNRKFDHVAQLKAFYLNYFPILSLAISIGHLKRWVLVIKDAQSN